MKPNEILELKCTGLKVAPEEQTLALAEARQAILNFCNLLDLPEELNFVCASMAHDLIVHSLSQKLQLTGEAADTSRTVTSMKVGDTSLSFAAPGVTDASKNAAGKVNAFLHNYKEQLYSFRRGAW